MSIFETYMFGKCSHAVDSLRQVPDTAVMPTMVSIYSLLSSSGLVWAVRSMGNVQKHASEQHVSAAA